MDTYSSGEDLLIKTRKPYTISKQRERWTEEEHNRFLEALKLHGRAWQKIEEHIGTKTAVQIRSHAQKFFTKLEKEALAKGVPKALDIEIPPPRPKRKPSNPYPRKTGLVSLEKFDGDERAGKQCDNAQNENDYSEVLNLFQGASCTSSPAIVSRNSCTFREFVPIRKMVHDDGTNNTLNLEKAPRKRSQSEKTNENSQPENCGEFSSNDMQPTKDYPKHAPVHVLNPSLETNTQNVSVDMPYQEPNQNHHPNPYFSYAETASAFANTQHFDPFHNNQDNYHAYIQASSAFSGLLVSHLLQNPAAHAAATFAASFWPSAASFSSRRENLPPSMTAIAAATVAAATAWWTTHGLLLSSPPPLHTGSNINPSSVPAVISVADKKENEISSQDQREQAQQQSPLKSPAMSLSDSEKSEGTSKNDNIEEAINTVIAAEPNNTTSVKQVDRSSCGSNTPSSSEVETDALKMEKAEEREEQKEQPDDSDFNNCRGGRSSFITSDSWKEVSEEGRLAFQALFSREVLPQSFLSSNVRNKGNNQTINIDKNEKVEGAMELDLNSNMWGNINTSLRSESNDKLLQWTMGIGQVKLKARGTGFKPYKRLRFS